jgi:site-specific DNA-cytosine methylase
VKKIILSLCGGSGSWEKPYTESLDYQVINVTLPENDVRTYTPPSSVYGVLAAPPCEAFSFARRPAGKRNKNFSMDIDSGLEIVNACLSVIKKCNPYFGL